jgi:DNA primase
MITIWKTPIVVTVEQVLKELKLQLYSTGLLRDMNNTGSDLMVTCPFHKGGKEHKPSCGISLKEKAVRDRTYEAGTVHCYTCGYTADFPTFIKDLLGLKDSYEGFKWLVGRYNYSSTEREPIELDLYRGQAQTASYMDVGMVEEYASNLMKSERALSYLKGRCLSEEVLEVYRCGYDPADDVVLFPVYDLLGNVLFYKGRSIAGKRFYNAKDIDKTQVVYGLYQLTQLPRTEVEGRQIWIVESEIDALSLISKGELAIAIMGSHISEAQCKELEKTMFRRFILGTDNDDAGRKGANQIKDWLIPKGFRFTNLQWLTELKDINELIKNYGDSYKDYLTGY